MKNLLNITVFTSAVLSIFSTSLTLYEAPDMEEILSAIDKEKIVQMSGSSAEIKRILISHDVSNQGKQNPTPLWAAKYSWKHAAPHEDYINVFGVRLPTKNIRRNI